MKRFMMVVFTDVRVQVRNNLYNIGIVVSLIVAVGLSQLVFPSQLFSVVPALLLMMIGATTMLYVGGMIMFEKEEGTLKANIVSPVTAANYLCSKIITLTALALLESAIIIGGALIIMSRANEIVVPNILMLVSGVITIGILYTLVGIILIVRYNKITDYLIPMALVILILQLPFLYYFGLVEQSGLLIIPTSAPTMLMQGAFIELTGGQWIYALGYSALVIITFAYWASRSFNNNIINKVG